MPHSRCSPRLLVPSSHRSLPDSHPSGAPPALHDAPPGSHAVYMHRAHPFPQRFLTRPPRTLWSTLVTLVTPFPGQPVTDTTLSFSLAFSPRLFPVSPDWKFFGGMSSTRAPCPVHLRIAIDCSHVSVTVMDPLAPRPSPIPPCTLRVCRHTITRIQSVFRIRLSAARPSVRPSVQVVVLIQAFGAAGLSLFRV